MWPAVPTTMLVGLGGLAASWDSLTSFARRSLPDDPEAHPRGKRRQDQVRPLIHRAGCAVDGLGRVAVGDVERIEEHTRSKAPTQGHRLLGSDVEYDDVVFAIGVHRLGKRVES